MPTSAFRTDPQVPSMVNRSPTPLPAPPRLLILDLLVERSEFGHGGNLEILRPFVDAAGRAEALLLTPQYQSAECSAAADSAISATGAASQAGRHSPPLPDGVRMLNRSEVPEWDESVPFEASRTVPLGAGEVELRRISMPSADRLADWLRLLSPTAVVCSGSRRNITMWEAWMTDAEALLRCTVLADVPTLGICFGHQMLCRAMGGRIERTAAPTHSIAPVELNDAAATDPMFGRLGRGTPLLGLYTHQEHVVDIGVDTRMLASSPHTRIAAVRLHAEDGRGRCAWGVQFHPEASEAQIDRALHLGHISEQEAAAFAGEHDGAAVLEAFASQALAAASRG